MSFDDGNYGFDEQDSDYTGTSQPVRQPVPQTQPQQNKPVYGGLSGLGQAITSAFQQPVKTWLGAGEWVKNQKQQGEAAKSGISSQAFQRQQKLQSSGYKPVDLQYSAPGNQPPANLYFKEDAGKVRYEQPGVKGVGGGTGYAEFNGQRKGGGSFSVIGSRTPQEQAGIDASVKGINSQIDALRLLRGAPSLAEEAAQQQLQRQFQQFQAMQSQFAPPPSDYSDQRAALMNQLSSDKSISGWGKGRQRDDAIKATLGGLGALDHQQAAERAAYEARLGAFHQWMSSQQQQEQAQRAQEIEAARYAERSALDQDKFDLLERSALDKAALSREWLEFQRSRATKGGGSRSDKRSQGVVPNGYVSPPGRV